MQKAHGGEKAKLCRLVYQKIEEVYGVENGREYVREQTEALGMRTRVELPDREGDTYEQR